MTRKDTIRKDEVEVIDYDTSFALFRIREDHFRGQQVSFTPISAVQKALGDELDVIEHFEMEYKMDDVEIEPKETDWSSPVSKPQFVGIDEKIDKPYVKPVEAGPCPTKPRTKNRLRE